MTTEPARIIGFITSVAAAVIAVLVAFSVPLSPEQKVAVLGLVAALAPAIAGLIIRGFVTPARRRGEHSPAST